MIALRILIEIRFKTGAKYEVVISGVEVKIRTKVRAKSKLVTYRLINFRIILTLPETKNAYRD